MAENKEQTELSESFINHIESIIKITESNKKRLSIEPSFALHVEIFKAAEGQGYRIEDVKKALSILAKQKRVTWGETIKYKYFISNQKNED